VKIGIYYRGRGRGRGRGKERRFHPNDFNTEKNNKILHVNDIGRVKKRHVESTCHRCGIKGHLYQTCHIPKYLADLYQASQKAKERDVETNLICDESELSFKGRNDDNPLDMADFLD